MAAILGTSCYVVLGAMQRCYHQQLLDIHQPCKAQQQRWQPSMVATSYYVVQGVDVDVDVDRAQRYCAMQRWQLCRDSTVQMAAILGTSYYYPWCHIQMYPAQYSSRDGSYPRHQLLHMLPYVEVQNLHCRQIVQWRWQPSQAPAAPAHACAAPRGVSRQSMPLVLLCYCTSTITIVLLYYCSSTIVPVLQYYCAIVLVCPIALALLHQYCTCTDYSTMQYYCTATYYSTSTRMYYCSSTIVLVLGSSLVSSTPGGHSHHNCTGSALLSFANFHDFSVIAVLQ